MASNALSPPLASRSRLVSSTSGDKLAHYLKEKVCMKETENFTFEMLDSSAVNKDVATADFWS